MQPTTVYKRVWWLLESLILKINTNFHDMNLLIFNLPTDFTYFCQGVPNLFMKLSQIFRKEGMTAFLEKRKPNWTDN